MFLRVFYSILLAFLLSSPKSFSSKGKEPSSEECKEAVLALSESRQTVQQETQDELMSILALPVESLNLSPHSHDALKTSNIKYIGDLLIKTERDLLRNPRWGRQSLDEIKEILSTIGLTLGMDIDWLPPATDEKNYIQPLLSPMEEKVLKMLFGMEGEGHYTSKEIEQFFNLLPKKLRDIQAKALRKIFSFGYYLLEMKDLTLPLNSEQVEMLIKNQKTSKVEWTPVFTSPVESMGFPAPVESSLKDNGINYFGELVQKSEEMLIKLGLSKKQLDDIKIILSGMELYLGADMDWPSDKKQVEKRVESLNPKRELTSALAYPVEVLYLPVRSVVSLPIYSTIKNLENNEIHYIGDLVVKTEWDLLRVPGFKGRILDWIKFHPSKMNLQLGMNVDWPSDKKKKKELIERLNPRPLTSVLAYPVEVLNLPQTHISILKNNRIHYIEDLVTKTEAELLPILERKRLNEIKTELSEINFELGTNTDSVLGS